MVVSFNAEEAAYIRKCLYKHEWWQSQKIVEKIDNVAKLDKEQTACEHQWGIYKGEKCCCSFCGKWPEKGYETWTLTKKKPTKEVTGA